MLREKNKWKLKDVISFFAIFVAFFFMMNGDLYNSKSNLIYYFPYLVCLIALALEILLSWNGKITQYILWRILLLLCFVVSMLYAIDFNSAFIAVKRFALQTCIVLLIAYKCMNVPQSIKLVIKLFILAAALNVVYMFSIVNFSKLSQNLRLGAGTLNNSWNANDIGLFCALSAILLFYDYRYKEIVSKKGLWLYLLLGAAFLICTVLSGSRKSVLILIIVGLFYLLFKSKDMAKNIVITLSVLVAAIYLLFNVPFLYDYIGYRLEAMLNFFQEDGATDNSMIMRQDMISLGFEYFLQSPFFGHGVNCFRILYEQGTGFQTYSHNNVIELLSGVGLVGLLLYYVYLFKALFKKRAKNSRNRFLRCLLFSVMILDYGIVSYYSALIQIVICLIISLMNVKEKECVTPNE